MAGKKKSKKDKKAARKAKKDARKAAKKAKRAVAQTAPRAAAASPKKAASRPATKPATKPAAKKQAARKALAPRTTRPARKERRHQPENLRLRSAGPSFTVSDVEKSLAFYRDVLGFTPKERWEEEGALRGVEMVAGKVSFWLGQDDWKKGRDRVKGQGFRMYCETSQDVDGIAQRMRDAGLTLLEEPKDEPWGGRAFAVVDPDGFAITFASGS
jgi:lactoylglutathione lyase